MVTNPAYQKKSIYKPNFKLKKPVLCLAFHIKICTKKRNRKLIDSTLLIEMTNLRKIN